LPATYEVVYGHAWKGKQKSHEVPLSMMQGKRMQNP
jgi:hypothetical protein